jgi:hypothetical protein
MENLSLRGPLEIRIDKPRKLISSFRKKGRPRLMKKLVAKNLIILIRKWPKPWKLASSTTPKCRRMMILNALCRKVWKTRLKLKIADYYNKK